MLLLLATIFELTAHLLECVTVVALFAESPARIEQFLHFCEVIAVCTAFLGRTLVVEVDFGNSEVVAALGLQRDPTELAVRLVKVDVKIFEVFSGRFCARREHQI